MSIEEINALEEEDKNSGKAPRAQYVLAEQVTRLVHGEEGLQAAKRITECLFSGSLSALSEADFDWSILNCNLPVVRHVKLSPPMPSPLTVKNSPILNTSLKKKIVCLVVLPYCVAVKRITV